MSEFPAAPVTKYHKLGGVFKTTEIYSLAMREARGPILESSSSTVPTRLEDSEVVPCPIPAPGGSWPLGLRAPGLLACGFITFICICLYITSSYSASYKDLVTDLMAT